MEANFYFKRSIVTDIGRSVATDLVQFVEAPPCKEYGSRFPIQRKKGSESFGIIKTVSDTFSPFSLVFPPRAHHD